MLRVLQHYLPIRTALLVLSETVILTAVLAAGMTQHLWEALSGRRDEKFVDLSRELARLRLTPDEAFIRCILSSILITMLCQVAMGFNQLYSFRISSSRYARAARFVESAGMAIAMAVITIFLTHLWKLDWVLDFPGLSLSQRVQSLVTSLVMGFGVLYLWRGAYHWVMRRVNLNQRVLVLGSHGPAHSLVRQILAHPDAGYEVAGLVPEPPRNGASARALGDEPTGTDAPRVSSPDHAATDETRDLVLESVGLLEKKVENRGTAMAHHTGNGAGSESLLSLARGLHVDTLVVALEDRRQLLPTEELLRCRLAGIDVREREEIYEQVTGRIAVAAMRPSYLIFNEGFSRHPWAALLKRLVDVALALLILAVCWPVMLLAVVLVKLDSPGPILYRQERVGQFGRPFTLMKFRSMRQDAEASTGPVWSAEDDPRITRSGRFMRKTRIDELPQLFNVITGSMSLVGPRPERQHFVDELAEQIPYYHQRHIVKPGLTGWAQINYPYGNTKEDALAKLQYDLFYIKNHSILFDLSILFSTIKTVVLRQGT